MESLISFVVFIAFYAYISYSLQIIGKKLGVENAWLAWIPVANLYVLCLAAGKPAWWIILCLVPIVNLVVSVILWVSVTKRLGKSPWLLLLFLVPLVNMALIGYLAFA